MFGAKEADAPDDGVFFGGLHVSLMRADGLNQKMLGLRWNNSYTSIATAIALAPVLILLFTPTLEFRTQSLLALGPPNPQPEALELSSFITFDFGVIDPISKCDLQSSTLDPRLPNPSPRPSPLGFSPSGDERGGGYRKPGQGVSEAYAMRPNTKRTHFRAHL